MRLLTRSSHLSIFLLISLALPQTINALITLCSIRHLGTLTEDWRCRIAAVSRTLASKTGEGGQVRFETGDVVEEIINTALDSIHESMRLELDIPLDTPRNASSSDCEGVRADYHAFMASTVRLLHAVQEAQMSAGWGRESGVFGGLEGLQRVWASRRGNEQDRSFIEQQLACYTEEAPSGCFAKNEVLRADVEVVEYLNWLLEEFV